MFADIILWHIGDLLFVSRRLSPKKTANINKPKKTTTENGTFSPIYKRQNERTDDDLIETSYSFFSLLINLTQS